MRPSRQRNYVYTDVQGNPLYRVVRNPGKRFHQERWDAELERFVNGLGDAPRVLYNLPAVVEEAARGGIIFIAEGERDVNALKSQGLTATTNPGGAGKWRDEYADCLRGAGKVVICYDLDKPDEKTGRRPGEVHALAVAASVGKMVGTVDFARAAEGKDVSDHIDAGYGVSELIHEPPDADPAPPPRKPSEARSRHAEGTPEPAVYQLAVARLHAYAVEHRLRAPVKTTTGWDACCPAHDDNNPSLGIRVGDDHPLVVACQKGCEPEDVVEALGINWREAFDNRRPTTKVEGSLRHHGPEELAKPPATMRWLIRGVWPLESHGGFGGKQKTLKTTTAMAGGLAVASGKPMFMHEPWSVPEPGPVLYFVGEGGFNFAHRKVQRIADDIYAIPPAKLGDVPFHLMVGIADMNSDYYRKMTMEFVQEFGRPRLVVLDSLYNFHSAGVEAGNLYSRGPMLSDYQHFIERECGPCGLWVVDHFRKSADSNALDEFMMSGMGPWADSWWLARARREHDPDEGRSWLTVDIGTRQATSGGVYHVDIDEGPFDEQANVYTRPMSIEIRRAREGLNAARRDAMVVVAAVGDNPGIVKRNLESQIGVTKPKVEAAENLGLIVITKGTRGSLIHHLTPAGEAMYAQRNAGPSVVANP